MHVPLSLLLIQNDWVYQQGEGSAEDNKAVFTLACISRLGISQP